MLGFFFSNWNLSSYGEPRPERSKSKMNLLPQGNLLQSSLTTHPTARFFDYLS